MLAFTYARHEHMVKGDKVQEKVSEVILNHLWSGWPCVKDKNTCDYLFILHIEMMVRFLEA